MYLQYHVLTAGFQQILISSDLRNFSPQSASFFLLATNILGSFKYVFLIEFHYFVFTRIIILRRIRFYLLNLLVFADIKIDSILFYRIAWGYSTLPSWIAQKSLV